MYRAWQFWTMYFCKWRNVNNTARHAMTTIVTPNALWPEEFSKQFSCWLNAKCYAKIYTCERADCYLNCSPIISN